MEEAAGGSPRALRHIYLKKKTTSDDKVANYRYSCNNYRNGKMSDAKEKYIRYLGRYINIFIFTGINCIVLLYLVLKISKNFFPRFKRLRGNITKR